MPGVTRCSSRRGWPEAASRGNVSRHSRSPPPVRSCGPCWRASTLHGGVRRPRKFSTISPVSRRWGRPRRCARPGWSPAHAHDQHVPGLLQPISAAAPRDSALAHASCARLRVAQASRGAWSRRSSQCCRAPGELRAWRDVGNQGRAPWLVSTFNQVERGPQMQGPARSMAVRAGGHRRGSGQARLRRPSADGGGLIAPQVGDEGWWSSRRSPLVEVHEVFDRQAAASQAVSSSGLAWKWLTQPTHR